jgi:hypothetical protein
VSDSILTSTKKVLGIAEEYTAFDVDILMHINSVFSTLQQLGVGPAEGYVIEDDSPTWSDFLGDDPRYNTVRSYVYLRVRMLFDPPGTSYLIESLRKQAEQMEWRMNVAAEELVYEDPFGPEEPDDEVESIYDGGGP